MALSVENINFLDEGKVAVKGHINPSTNVYQIFDLQTGKVLEEYYGYGFTYTDGIVYYVQAPQHFGDTTGYNRILSSDGRLIYESEAQALISPDLKVSDDVVTFYEKNSVVDEWNENICSVASMLRTSEDIYYYN